MTVETVVAAIGVVIGVTVGVAASVAVGVTIGAAPRGSRSNSWTRFSNASMRAIRSCTEISPVCNVMQSNKLTLNINPLPRFVFQLTRQMTARDYITD